MRGQRLDIVGYCKRGALVAFADRKIKQVAGFGEPFGQGTDAADNAFEVCAFLAQILRALRIVPDIRVFKLARDFFEALGLGIEVKDTP